MGPATRSLGVLCLLAAMLPDSGKAESGSFPLSGNCADKDVTELFQHKVGVVNRVDNEFLASPNAGSANRQAPKEADEEGEPIDKYLSDIACTDIKTETHCSASGCLWSGNSCAEDAAIDAETLVQGNGSLALQKDENLMEIAGAIDQGAPCSPSLDGHRRRSSVHMWTNDSKFDADHIDESCVRHIGSAACGSANSSYTIQAARLVRSIILSQLTNLRNKTCSWTLWLVVDANSADYMNKSITAALETSDLLDTPATLKVVLIDAGFVPGDIHQFHICSNAVINLYHILPPSVAEYMYLAADELVVGDLDSIWDNAKQLGWDENHLLAAAEECVEPRGACGWYSDHSDVRFGENGISFASCILSVKALRKYQFDKWVVEVAQNGSYNIQFGDQDFANLYGKLYPEHMVLLQCNTNVRSDSGCDVEKKQPIVLHGNRQAFHENSDWKAVAVKVDEMFDSLSRDCGRHLVGPSVWQQIDIDVREGWKSSLSRPWGLSPQQDHPPRK